MDDENQIRLSGPFDVIDGRGRTWSVSGIRIHDEGYGIVDVYVDFVESLEEDPLYEDGLVIAQILLRLREIGYEGPDFGAGDPGMQEDHVLVLEAPEAFGAFAASKGWRNLAEAYADHPEEADGDVVADPASRTVYFDLIRRLRGE